MWEIASLRWTYDETKTWIKAHKDTENPRRQKKTRDWKGVKKTLLSVAVLVGDIARFEW